MNTQDEVMNGYTEIWMEVYPNLMRIASRRLQSCQSEIEDAVSKVALAFIAKIESGDPPVKPRAWLYGTLDNIIKMTYEEVNKKRKHQESLEALDPENHVLCVEKDMTDEVINSKFSDVRIEHLKDVLLDDLNEAERKLYCYIYEDKKKLRQIAQEIDKTEPAVRQSHYRLVRKLRIKVKRKIDENL